MSRLLVGAREADLRPSAGTMPLDLAALAQPVRLLEPARLYITVRDADGAQGVRRFLSALAVGAAVHRLAAPGASFLLVSDTVGTRAPAVTQIGVTRTASEAWLAMLLGLDVFAAAPAAVAPGLTEAHAESDVAAATDHIASLLAQCCIAERTGEARRRESSLARDDAGFGRALGIIHDTIRGVDTGAMREARAARDPLERALREAAAAEGIMLRRLRLRPAAGDWRDQLTDRAAIDNFRVRRVALDGAWWREDGPSLIVEDMSAGVPRALIGSQAGYRMSAASGRRRKLTDDKARCFAADAMMVYPSMPEQVSGRRLLAFAAHRIRRDGRRFVLATFAVALLGLIMPVAAGILAARVIPDGRIGLLQEMVLGLLQEMVLGLVAGAAAVATCELGASLAQMRVISRVDWRLQAAVWDRVIRLPTGFFRNFSTGDLAARIRTVDDVRRTLSWVTVNGIIGGLLSLTSIVLMRIYDLRLGLMGCVYGCTLALLLFVIKVKRERLLRAFYAHRGIVSGLTLQLLDGIRKLKVAAAEPRAFVRWVRAFALQRSSVSQDARLVNIQTVLVAGGPLLGTLAAFVIAGARDPTINVSKFAAFSAAFMQFTDSVATFAAAIGVGTIVMPMARRLAPILDAQPEVADHRADPGTLRGRIAMRNVSFRYRDDGPWILEDIDFTAEPGSFVAIVGPSGSGKSTMLRLLLGFETPRRGSVFYDERDLARLDLRLVRRQIGTVLQSIGLVPGTIYENIAGSAVLGTEQVMQTAAVAGLADDIAAMPMGLETIVSEGGTTLSGGQRQRQRQRVMIARALLRKPNIVFFDEATSALDNRTQAVVSESLARLSATRVVIAHRLSTIRGADVILVVEGGRIVERGGFGELMSTGGSFYRLASRQML